MKKCCFIIPYFGNFPNYFQQFLNSCKTNQDYDWLIITDNVENYNYPKNVKKIKMSFPQLRDLIQSKFDFQIALEKPFKICDYRPAFGYIFTDFLSDYKWWGHCDIDTLMGDLNDFITDDMLIEYDKLFTLGHFIMYKNNIKKNKLFMTEINGEHWYRKVFTTNKAMIFDEVYGGKENINTIFKYTKQKVYENDVSLNFDPTKPTKFVKTTYYSKLGKFKNEKQWENKLVVWDNNKILRYQLQNNEVKSTKYMYLHLQARKMKIQKDLNNKKYAIIPNEFMNITKDDFYQSLKEYKKIRKIETKLKFENLIQLDKAIINVRRLKKLLLGKD